MGVLNLGKVFHDELTGKIVLVMLFLVLFVAAFVIFLRLYTKWYIKHHPSASPATASVVVRRRRRLDFSPGYHVESSTSTVRCGLDPTVLDSIPIMTFSQEEHQEKGMECAVCLSDVSQGEKLRILPKCHHGFHVECIDMWFQSHQTCPLCRIIIPNPDAKLPLSSSETTTLDSILQAARTQNTTNVFPTNVLFWGNHTQLQEVSGTQTLSNNDVNEEEPTSSGAVAIDMPRPAVLDESSDEQVGIVTVRLRSLRRLLTRDSRLNPCTTTAHTTSQL